VAGQFVPKFSARQRNGVLMFVDPDRIRAFLVSLGPDDLDVVIQKRKKSRSDRQNRYYWSCVVGTISDHTGMTPEDTHDALKQMFLSRVVFVPVEGGVQEVTVGRSSSVLKTHEFEEYLEKIRRWASADLNLVIPDPNTVEVTA
jgi:hypothetical protein